MIKVVTEEEAKVALWGHPYMRNHYPGLFLVVDGPDRVGKTTIVKRIADSECMHDLAYNSGTDPKHPLRVALDDMLVSGEGKKYPSRFENIMTALDHIAQVETLIPALKRGVNVIMDRWFTSAIVYGQATGLPLDYIIALKQHLLVPDAVLLISRDNVLPGRDEKLNTYDQAEFQQVIRSGYQRLLNWWKTNVPYSPIGMVSLSVEDDETISYRRALRRFKDIINQGG